jgi:chlorite dismutase
MVSAQTLEKSAAHVLSSFKMMAECTSVYLVIISASCRATGPHLLPKRVLKQKQLEFQVFYPFLKDIQ